MSNTTTTVAAVAAGGVLVVGAVGAVAVASAQTSGPAAEHQAIQELATLPNGREIPIHNFSLSSGYGHHTGVHAGQHHPGQDFAAPMRTPIYSATAGKVIHAGPDGGYGNAVIVKTTEGSKVLYGHMSKTLVKKGRTVAEGQRIGLVGSTGYSTGPHLHFEVRTTHDNTVDPIRYLGVSKQHLVQLEKQISKLRHEQ